MPLACLDTHILIWAIQRVARAGQEEMIPRARALLAQLDKDRVPVVVPSVVIGEFLLGLPIDEYPIYQEVITRRFIVVPYDLRAAVHFARVWREKRDVKVIEVLQQAGATRTELRADTMIVATALAVGATVIYGHDTGVKNLADGFIEFRNVGEIEAQLSLLDEPPSL